MVDRATGGPSEAALSEIQGEAELALRFKIHDVSRFEWSVAVPLPQARPRAYEIQVELEVPTGAAARQNPWDQLQTFTRLDGPRPLAMSDEPTIERIRRDAVGLAQMLSRARDGFVRHCRSARTTPDILGDPGPSYLTIWLDAALRAVQEGRDRLTKGEANEAALIARERVLVDEFMSVRLLDMLCDARREVHEIPESAGSGLDASGSLLAQVDAALKAEFAHRAAAGYLRTDISVASAPEHLERYVARAAQLKKHFEEVLFLERESYQLDLRVSQGIAVLATLAGGSAAFVLQLLFIERRFAFHQLEEPGASLLSGGLALLAVAAGVIYAMRERIKEFGRTWVVRKVYRFHAQRVSRARVPAHRLATRDVIVRAREWCDQGVRTQPDALNPEAGASLQTTLVRYRHRGRILPQPALATSGVSSVRHIFRYEFTPLFSRLTDETKEIPVLKEGEISFAQAPRRYRVPVRIRLSSGGEMHDQRMELVLDKGGLRRIEPVETEGANQETQFTVPAGR
ncbi:MAG TPA: hypothetical protein VMK12_31820 [Anaeromyxobacteraceae bacterium]|nr:hypothetical protein [Anaeromyxobacteraceae bacterium]